MPRPPDTPLRRADLDPDPFELFTRWFADARQVSPMAEAMALCTADAEGRPSGRMVLLKGISPRGFDFYTNYESRKGRELEENPSAALVLWWVELDRQVRVEGAVSRIPAAESDAYFGSRPRDSRLAALASPQSRPVAGRDALEARVTELGSEHEGREVPRPRWWGGYRVDPEAIEFWQGRSGRLHDRFVYRRGPGGSWEIERLAP